MIFAIAGGRVRNGSRRVQHFVGRTVALLFFQSSTRTRLGFEAATVALGCPFDRHGGHGHVARSNARAAESLEDCAAVISRLCDAIVVRHHEHGAAARMAAKSVVARHQCRRRLERASNPGADRYLCDAARPRHDQGKSIAFGGDPRGRVGTLADATAAVRRTEGDRVLSSAALRGAGRYLLAISENQIRRRVIATSNMR